MRNRLFIILVYFIGVIFCVHVIMIYFEKIFGLGPSRSSNLILQSNLPRTEELNSPEEQLSYLRQYFQNELNTTLVRQELFGNLTKDSFQSKFVIENDGKPIQSILLSTLRSGSSFTGQLLASIPNTLYYFEPLMYVSTNPARIRGPPRRDEAINLLQTLLMCNHSSSPSIRKALMELSFSFLPRSLSLSASLTSKLCRTPEMTSAICRMSPFHLMKIIRLHLSLTESLLTNSLLNVNLLYLVRDPRGTMNSRKRGNFCGKPEACNISLLCQDLESEFYVANRLIRKFPNRFKVVRYEDLTENVLPITKNLLNFFGFELHSRVMQFINENTGSQPTGRENTYGLRRDSKKNAVQWKEELSFEEIQSIQNSCVRAMQLWGYKMVSNTDELKNFTPYLKNDEYDSKKVLLKYQ